MRRNIVRQSGFTLIEIAIVLLVVAILLGYSVAMLPVQQELKQYRHANDEMNMIIDQLIAFAQVNGRLPCPDDDDPPDGEEDRTGAPPIDNDCNVYYGYLPARTLGIDGKYSGDGALIDPWGSPYRYAVSETDAGDGNFDFVTANGIRDEGMANVVDPALDPPDLYLCSDSATTDPDDKDCSDVTGDPVVENVAAVIVSLGKDYEDPATSNIQAENMDDFQVSPPLDGVFIAAPRREDYDDIVKWVSTNLLFSKMIEAGQLP